MLVPVLIFLGAMSVGVLASARWLPDLAEGQVGGLAFFLVCGMLGAALGVAGMHVFELVEELGQIHANDLFGDKEQIVAGTLRSIAVDSGSLVGLAAIVYLLAPAPLEEDELRAEPVSQTVV